MQLVSSHEPDASRGQIVIRHWCSAIILISFYCFLWQLYNVLTLEIIGKTPQSSLDSRTVFVNRLLFA